MNILRSILLILFFFCHFALPLQNRLYPTHLAPLSDIDSPNVKTVKVENILKNIELFFEIPLESPEIAKSNFEALTTLLAPFTTIKVEFDPKSQKIKRIADEHLRGIIREELFSGLYEVLDALETEVKFVETKTALPQSDEPTQSFILMMRQLGQLPPPVKELRYNREDQIKFAQIAQPKIQRWVQKNREKLRQLLPFVIELPAEGAGYARNEALAPESKNRRERYSIYSHAWAPKGETDFHTHGGALAFTTPLFSGFEETTLTSEEELKKPWDNQVLTFSKTTKELIPGEVSAITRGKNSNHKIRNSSDQLGIMIEIYIWPPTFERFKSVNNSIPVEGEEGKYFVIDEPVGNMPYKISTRLNDPKKSFILDFKLFKNEFPSFFDTSSPSKIFVEGIIGIFTAENTALVTIEAVKSYTQKNTPIVHELTLKEGNQIRYVYLLEVIPNRSKTPVTSPSLAVAKAL